MSERSWGVWPARVTWLLLPALVAPAIADALDGASTPVRWVAGVGLWAVWAVTLVAVLVPASLSLTALRIAAPAALLAAVAAAFTGDPGLADAVALGGAVAAVAAALAAPTADAFVDGSSYGDERRFALRTPLLLGLTVAPLAWLMVVAPPAAGALLLAARQWVAGGAVIAIGAPLAVAAARRLHNLSRRWIVFVPAGVVLHDPIQLAEPVLFARRIIAAIGPANVDDAAVPGADVSGGALGLALILRLRTPARITASEVDRVVFTPGRPGAVLTEARRRRLPVSPVS